MHFFTVLGKSRFRMLMQLNYLEVILLKYVYYPYFQDYIELLAAEKQQC